MNMVGAKPEALPVLPSPTKMDRQTDRCRIPVSQHNLPSTLLQHSWASGKCHYWYFHTKGFQISPEAHLKEVRKDVRKTTGFTRPINTILTIRWTSEHTADLGPKQPQNLPLIRKKKAPVSLATARAISVLPVPGGPYSRIPRGGWGQRQVI